MGVVTEENELGSMLNETASKETFFSELHPENDEDSILIWFEVFILIVSREEKLENAEDWTVIQSFN